MNADASTAVLTSVGLRGTGALPPKGMAPDAQVQAAIAAATKPDRMDWSPFAQPAMNQLSTPECVGFGSCAYDEILIGLLFGARVAPRLSPEWVYNECKKIDGNPGPGTWTTVAAQVLKDLGDVREQDYPFDPAKDGQAPPSSVPTTTEYKVAAWSSFSGRQAILDALVLGPVHLTIQCSSQFLSPQSGGLVDTVAGEPETNLFHGPLAVGYDNTKQRIAILNSWGPDYGVNGYCYPSYDWMDRWVLSGVSYVPDTAGKLLDDLDGNTAPDVVSAHIALLAAVHSRILSPELLRLAREPGGAVTVRDAVRILARTVGL